MPLPDVPQAARAEALHVAQGRILELAIQDVPLHDTLDAIARTVEALSTSGVLVSILLLDEDGTHLRHGGAPSLPAAYNAAIDGLAIGPGVGACGAAAYRREPVQVPDIDRDPLWADFRDLASSHGLRACWSTPIVSAKYAVLGTLALYYREPRAVDPDDLQMVAFVVRSVALVIERIKANDRLRNSEALYRQIVEGAEDFAIVMLDERGTVISWNSGAERIVGYTDAEAIGRPAAIFFTAEDKAADIPTHEMNRARSDGRAVDERWHRRKDDSRFWGSGLIMRLDREGGGFLKMFRDRTAEHVAEAALRDSEARLRELNDTLEARVAARTAERNRLWRMTSLLVAVAGFDSTIREVNPAWRTVLGWSEAELIGQSYAAFLHPDDVERSLIWAANLAKGEEVVELENRYRCKDGSYRWIAWTIVASDGVFHCVGRDVTGQKEAQADLEAAQEALRQSQKLEAVGQLTGGVAHDFNNLLTVIRGSIDLLRRPELPEAKRQRYMDAISETTMRATKLTAQLLAFSRRQALKPEVFDAGSNVAGVAAMIGTLVGARIHLTVEAPDAPLFVSADPSQFDTALVNMAVNARDAMDGEGRLTVAVRAADTIPAVRAHPATPGAFVAIAVTDTGTGIAADAIDRIFEPFFTTKGVGKGTGLGLSQVFGFAKQSGGEVTVESVPGQGATFTLYLPQVARATGEEHAPATAEQPTDGRGRCVLVVEDNAQVGAFALQALDELGYSTVLAPDGPRALAELANDAARFDVVFSDVVMPGMSGIELGKAIRRLYPDLPVILTSGYSHVLAQSGSAGFELLHKPYSVDELSRLLRQASKRPQGRAAEAL